MFTAVSECQPLGSLLLGKFMQLFKDEGFNVSTFDMGNVPTNDQGICCSVEDYFDTGFNYGSSVMAARYIRERGSTPTTYREFTNYVNRYGGFLSSALEREVHEMWNMENNPKLAYSASWAAGVIPIGYDGDVVYNYQPEIDAREQLLEGLSYDCTSN
jgi:hypothetical protein